jgi:glutamate synthase domain-containing protein 3
MKTIEIDSSNIFYKNLNDMIRDAANNGTRKILLQNVFGQRYIATGLRPTPRMEIEIFGTPGNDLGAFMDGHRIVVHGNAQDGVGNTMNSGEITVHGRAGDILGMSMRGGKIFVRDDVGYRVAIHMKEYMEKRPVVVIGGTAQDFFGEYMAGGIVILLGLSLKNGMHKSNFIGTGMHGGVIYIRGKVSEHQLGKEVGISRTDESDREILSEHVGEFASRFKLNVEEIMQGEFTKLLPVSKRPYGRLYAY